MSSSTSFNRNNIYYQSLPINSSAKLLQQPTNSSSASSQKSVNFKTTENESKLQSTINTEEFAKLDALLEDLLAEVDQPILLNHKETESKRPQRNQYFTQEGHQQVERSVDWLNEQKEILRARKEASQAQQPYRKIKSKLDYYITSSSQDGEASNSGDVAQIPIINNKPPVSPSTRQLYSPNTTTTMTNVTQIPIHQQAPASSSAHTQSNANSFRSLSTNPALLKNINETDDENLIDSEFDRFSQKSYKSMASTMQRTKYHVVSNDYIESTRPTAATPVPTFNPGNRSFYQSKRALSAPPTEVGKVVLQRMELKSPLTVRQPSVVPFEHPQNGEQIMIAEPSNSQTTTMVSQQVPNQQRSFIDNPYNNRGVLRGNNYTSLQSQQQPVFALPQPSQVVPVTRNVYLNRSYSEVPRAGVYTNGYETDSGLISNQQPALAYGTYRQPASTPQPQIVYTQVQHQPSNGYVESEFDQSAPRQHYRVVNASPVVGVGSYRTIGGPVSGNRYQLINDQSGYDTDTGLIKLRHVLDSTRRASSRNTNNGSISQQNNGSIMAPTPTPIGYVGYQQQLSNGRCYTPQFSTGHLFNGQQQPPQMRIVGQQYNSQSNLPNASNASFIDNGAANTSYQMDEFPNLIQPINDFQYIDSNGNLVKGVPAFVSPDGRQIILKDIDPISGIGEAIVTPPPQQILSPQPHSFIVQHQMAPSSASVSANSTLARNTSQNNGIRVTSSSSNLASSQQQQQQQTPVINGKLAASMDAGNMANGGNREEPRRASAASLSAESEEVIKAHPKFVKSTQHFWYKPKISRDEAITLLKDKPPGTFLIRDSNNFPGAYGLALKVDKPPANVQIKPGTDPQNELVRHFLIEPTPKGVRVKGCCNEPIFGSLAALVYHHSLKPLALPIKLILPNHDLTTGANIPTSPSNVSNLNGQDDSNSRTNTLNRQQSTSASMPADGRHLLDKGAACNVFYLNTVNVDSRSGLEAISHALNNTKAFTNKDSSHLLLIQFKVNSQGVTITDLNKKKFIRQHFPTNTVVYCAVDEKYTWPNRVDKISKPRIFGLVCKPLVNKGTNECHLFVELDPEQPAIAIVDFINRYLIPSKLSSK